MSKRERFDTGGPSLDVVLPAFPCSDGPFAIAVLRVTAGYADWILGLHREVLRLRENDAWVQSITARDDTPRFYPPEPDFSGLVCALDTDQSALEAWNDDHMVVVESFWNRRLRPAPVDDCDVRIREGYAFWSASRSDESGIVGVKTLPLDLRVLATIRAQLEMMADDG